MKYARILSICGGICRDVCGGQAEYKSKNIFVGHFLYAALAVLFYGRDYRFLSGYCSFQFGDSGDVMAALWTVCNDKNYGYTVLFATFAVVHSDCQ